MSDDGCVPAHEAGMELRVTLMGDGPKRAFAAAKKTRTDPTMPKIMPPAVEIAMAKALGYSPSYVVGNPHGLRHVWDAIREALMKEGRE